MTVADLRAVAMEAGIAPEAFDQAADEEWAASGRERVARPTAWSQLAANIKAVAFFWVVLGMFAAACRIAGVDWPLRHLADILALALGGVVSHRLRARAARIGFVGLTAGLTIQFALQLVYGIGAVQGLVNQLAVLGAGVFGALGVAAALRIEGTKRPPAHSAEVPATKPAENANAAPTIDPRALKLRAV
jgi:hypothetical protein